MRIIIIFFCVFCIFKVNGQWLEADSASSLFYHANGSFYPEITDQGFTLLEERSICELPENKDRDSLYYRYYAFEKQVDLIFCEVVNKKTKLIIQTGFYRLIYQTDNYTNVRKDYKGYIITCWVKDMVWTHFQKNEIKNLFYNKGQLVDKNSISIDRKIQAR
jgi:hypothetical protein